MNVKLAAKKCTEMYMDKLKQILAQLRTKLIVLQGIENVEVDDISNQEADPLKTFTTANEVVDSLKEWQ